MSNTYEDALIELIEALRDGVKGVRKDIHRPYGGYGYHLYVPNFVFGKYGQDSREAKEDVARYYDAAAYLQRIGVLRPGPVSYGAQEVNSYGGFSITENGRKWLLKQTDARLLPSTPSRFRKLLAEHASRYGAAYQQRSEEALECYHQGTYLASCVMTGAAAASILLTLTTARTGNATEVDSFIQGSDGRALESLLSEHLPPSMQEEFKAYLGLLQYWQHHAIQGPLKSLGEEEAFTALLLLLKLAQFAEKQWTLLTKQTTP